MNNTPQKSVDLFVEGRNCAQAVFCTFCENCGISFEVGLKLASSFGGGMGRLREVCGAVSAMFMIAGLQKGYISNDDIDEKSEHYKLIQELADKFKKEHGSIICRELLGEEANGYIPQKRDEEYYRNRPCAKFIATASKIIEENLM